MQTASINTMTHSAKDQDSGRSSGSYGGRNLISHVVVCRQCAQNFQAVETVALPGSECQDVAASRCEISRMFVYRFRDRVSIRI